jgi:hypothetical protein
LIGLPVVAAAGRLGELFHVDPISLLDCTDDVWFIRYACAKVVERDHEEQSKKMRSGR